MGSVDDRNFLDSEQGGAMIARPLISLREAAVSSERDRSLGGGDAEGLGQTELAAD
jgi:hypothetical protein